MGKKHLFPYDPEAVGLVLWYNEATDKSVRIRYLSRTKNLVGLVNDTWNAYSKKGLEHEVKLIEVGCAEIVVGKSALENSDKILWIALMACLGQYVYL